MVKCKATCVLSWRDLYTQDYYLQDPTLYTLNTRQAAGGDIRIAEKFNSKQGLVRDGFRYRAAENYNRVPGHIRKSRTLATFKQWVSTNIPID